MLWTYLIIAIFVLLAIILVARVPDNFHFKKKTEEFYKVSQNRPKLDREDYIKSLTNQSYYRKQVEAIYDTTLQHLSIKGYSFYPEDNIITICQLRDLDDVEFILQVFKKLEMNWSNDGDIDEVNKKFDCLNAEYILALISQQIRKNNSVEQ